MSLTVTAYHNLQVSPFKLISLQELSLTKKINEHAILRFTGIVPKEIKLISEADISVNASKKILLSAEEEISLKCRESKIVMNGSVEIFGKEVKAN